ncbi:MAG: hypothetical protein WCO03_00380 [bacterium]
MAVDVKIEYALVKGTSGKLFWIAKELVEQVFKVDKVDKVEKEVAIIKNPAVAPEKPASALEPAAYMKILVDRIVGHQAQSVHQS